MTREEALRESPVQNDISYKIANHVREELDEFIFTVLGDWCGKQNEFINIKVSKEVLKQAILCYIKEHREDYERLLVNMPITKEETEWSTKCTQMKQ